MSIVSHLGRNPPTLNDWADPDNVQRVWFVWPSDRTISDSEWILPAGMTGSSELMAQSVTDGGVTYSNANSILIDVGNVADGRYTITNRVTFSPEEIIDRSCYVVVRNT